MKPDIFTNSHFINGKWVNDGLKTFVSVNPSTNEVLWKGQEASYTLIDHAVNSAALAFENWGFKTIDERIKYLKIYQNILKREKLNLAETISKENGKPLWDSLNEVSSMISKIDISIDAYHYRCNELKIGNYPGLSITRHKPHGVMVVLGPFNFPGHLPNGHIVPALLAGNTIVFKPSDLTPLTSSLMISYFSEADFPKGVINLIQGGKEIGERLVKHDLINGVLFTGSWNVGKKISETLSQFPYKILALEMGGNNPLIIGHVKDLQAAAYQTIQSAFLSSGQRCTCSRRLIIYSDIYDKFLNTLIEMTKKIKVGAYTDNPEPFMGPVISMQAAATLIQAKEQMINKGGISLLDLKRLNEDTPFLSPGIIEMTNVNETIDEEYFGPLLQVFKLSTLHEAITLANATKYGLTAGIICDDSKDFNVFYKKVKAGIINWNTPLTGASSKAPFGGIGQSGNNRPSAFYAADYTAYPVASLEAEHPFITPLPGIKLE